MSTSMHLVMTFSVSRLPAKVPIHVPWTILIESLVTALRGAFLGWRSRHVVRPGGNQAVKKSLSLLPPDELLRCFPDNTYRATL
jgi:hypothetical protein